MNCSLSGEICFASFKAANQSYKSILMSRANTGFDDFEKTSWAMSCLKSMLAIWPIKIDLSVSLWRDWIL